MHETNPNQHALLIGTSDGIGKGLARHLLARGWTVVGLSRSAGGPEHPDYQHIVVDVRAREYAAVLTSVLAERRFDLCIYCVGTGEFFDAGQLSRETETLRVNLLGLAETLEHVLPSLLAQGRGTFAGLSSLADALPGREAPSYAASKVGMSYYLEGIAGAIRGRGVSIVNVRLGFVDTKMAKSPVKPFMLSVDRAAQRILSAVLAERPRSRVNIPRRTAGLMWLIARLSGTWRLLRLGAG